MPKCFGGLVHDMNEAIAIQPATNPAEGDAAPGSGPDPASGVARMPWPRRWGGAIASAFDWVFGLVSIVAGLSLLSVIPVLNLLSLGYLLAASGRVAASGRLRDGFVGIRKASLAGSVLAGTWLASLPLRWIAGMAGDADLVAPGGRTARGWHTAVLVMGVLTVLHVAWAALRGGRLRHFAWPAPVRFLRWIRTPGKFPRARDAVSDYALSLHLPRYFWLGLRGFVGTLLWLLPPAALWIAAGRIAPNHGGGWLTLLGGLVLLFVAMHLPFLQSHFAVEDRFGALFEVRAVRRMFARAPIAFWIALLATLLFALPLYLLRIELPPRDIAWLPSVLFVAFIFPARLLVGWAVSRARRRGAPRHGFFRWSGRLAIVPVVLVYVLVVYLTQYLSWEGTRSLLEQHAFMVPAPLTSL